MWNRCISIWTNVERSSKARTSGCFAKNFYGSQREFALRTALHNEERLKYGVLLIDGLWRREAAWGSSDRERGKLFFPAYDAAADFFAGVSGGLGGEVVPLGMDDDGLSYDLFDRKAFVVKSRPGIALVPKQRNHITGVFRMEGIGWVEMASGFFEGAGTVSVLMNMHSIEIGRILRGNIGKAEYFRFDKDSFVRCTVKFYESA